MVCSEIDESGQKPLCISKRHCSLAFRRWLILRVDWKSLVLMNKECVLRGRLLLLPRIVSDALDFLELVFTHLRSLLKFVLDFTLEFLSGGLADHSLVL